MSKYEPKTKKNDGDVNAFIESIEDPQKREDCKTLLKIMSKITGEKAKMWGESIVGFGSYHYKYASGREGDWMLAGFSARKQNLPVYLISGFDKYKDLLKKLGKHSTGVSCLYLKRLSDVDLSVLEELIRLSVKHMKETYK